MYIDEYKIIVKGNKYDVKKHEDKKNVILMTMDCNDGIREKPFMAMLNEIFDAHEGQEAKITVEIKQPDYK